MGLKLTLSETPKTGFVVTRPIYLGYHFVLIIINFGNGQFVIYSDGYLLFQQSELAVLPKL